MSEVQKRARTYLFALHLAVSPVFVHKVFRIPGVPQSSSACDIYLFNRIYRPPRMSSRINSGSFMTVLIKSINKVKGQKIRRCFTLRRMNESARQRLLKASDFSLQRGIKQREAGVFIPRSRITTHKMLREVIDAEGMRIFVVTWVETILVFLKVRK